MLECWKVLITILFHISAYLINCLVGVNIFIFSLNFCHNQYNPKLKNIPNFSLKKLFFSLQKALALINCDRVFGKPERKFTPEVIIGMKIQRCRKKVMSG